MPDDIQHLVIKSIESYARLEARVGSIDQTLIQMRTEQDKILAKISESLEKLATIQERLSANHDAHIIIHKRIDDVKTELDETVEGITAIRLACQGANHTELLRRVDQMERSLKLLCDSLKVVGYKIKGIPVWMILVGLILIGSLIDVTQHWDVIKRFIP